MEMHHGLGDDISTTDSLGYPPIGPDLQPAREGATVNIVVVCVPNAKGADATVLIGKSDIPSSDLGKALVRKGKKSPQVTWSACPGVKVRTLPS